MPPSLDERLVEDIRAAATDLRDFAGSMETAAFHQIPHGDRMGFRALKNALSELGEAIKALPADGAACSDCDAAGAACGGTRSCDCAGNQARSAASSGNARYAKGRAA